MNDYQEYVIAALLLEAARDISLSGAFTIEKFTRIINQKPIAKFASTDELVAFADYAAKHRLGERVETPYAKPRFTLDMLQILGHLNKASKDTVVGRAQQLGMDWVLESLEGMTAPGRTAEPVTEIPASDRYVSITDNTETFEQAIRHLERVIAEFRDERINDPTVKSGVLSDLEFGLNAIRSRVVNPKAIQVVLGGALLWIAGVFAEQPVGELAKIAWDAVKALVGLS